MINIHDTIFDIVRSTNIQDIKLSAGAYFPFAPADRDIVRGNYFPINFLKKDNVGYLKHKHNNTWLYGDIKRKQGVFLPIHKNKFSLSNAKKQPTVCWLQYLCRGVFIIYRPHGYALEGLDFLKYIKTKNGAILMWVENIENATQFTYDDVKHENIVLNNKLGSFLYYDQYK